MALNDTQCRNSKPQQKPYFVGDSMGLGLYIRPSGVKSWQYRYRSSTGKTQTLTYGQYPALSLKEARDRHAPTHQMVKDGIDPRLEIKKANLSKQLHNENTFEKVARRWHDKKKGQWTDKYAKTIIHRLETDVFQHIGDIPIGDVTPHMLINIMETIEKRGVYEIQRRVLQYISQVFRFALPAKLVERDYTIEIFDTLAPTRSQNYACIKPEEFPEFLRRFYQNEGRSYDITNAALEMMMLTFLRTEELLFGRWEEVDWNKKRWVIPAERMKMKRDHIVPLSNQALKVLERLKVINGSREYIFASLNKPKQPISKNTVLHALYRMGYKGRMTGHGFRSLATTVALEELRYPKAVIEMQLSHVKGDVHGFAYDRAQYLDDRIKMMQDWSNHIDQQRIIGLKNELHKI